jgi:hypothetical protein
LPYVDHINADRFLHKVLGQTNEKSTLILNYFLL